MLVTFMLLSEMLRDMVRRDVVVLCVRHCALCTGTCIV